jgi:hypothetical protein
MIVTENELSTQIIFYCHSDMAYLNTCPHYAFQPAQWSGAAAPMQQ